MKLNILDDDFFFLSGISLWVKGYVLYKSEIYTKDKLIILIQSVIKNKNWSLLNGQFAIIAQLNNNILIISDSIRSIPIFYTQIKETVYLSSLASKIVAITKTPQINNEQSILFKNLGYTTSYHTLIQNIYQTETAQILEFSANGLKKENYIKQISNNKLNCYSETKTKFKKLLYTVFEDYLSKIKNDEIALALSGGLDSRLIAFMLKEFSVKKVKCFSYGRENSAEKPKSQKVAQILDFDWQFVNYDKINTDGLLTDEYFLNYINYAGNMSSMPFLQEYFVIKELKNKKIISDESIFLPGHSADFLAGSHLRPWIKYKNTKLELTNFIANSNQFTNKTNASLKKEIENFYAKNADKISYKIAEKWDFQERQSKFITNSTRVFRYFDFRYFLIFWDRRLIQFFNELPYEYRLYKNLYDDVLQELFEPFGLWFKNDKQLSSSDFKFRKVKKMAKNFVPQKFLFKKQIKMDWMNYEHITSPMKNELIDKKVLGKNFYSYNYILNLWYLENVLSKL